MVKDFLIRDCPTSELAQLASEMSSAENLLRRTVPKTKNIHPSALSASESVTAAITEWLSRMALLSTLIASEMLTVVTAFPFELSAQALVETIALVRLTKTIEVAIRTR